MIPPDANAGFVAAMEDVLETYQKPRDPDRPLVCLDETSKQLIIETRAPIPAKPHESPHFLRLENARILDSPGGLDGESAGLGKRCERQKSDLISFMNS